MEISSKAAFLIASEGKYEYTKKIWDKTYKLRRYDFDSISHLIRENCECYIKKGNREDLKIASLQVREWKKNHGIWEHLSGSEKEQVYVLEKRVISLLEKTN
ncbi:hypothetical protein [Leptospira ilyithenensis]|uniref:Uncharacterized protein n=1 Tax=Leptospira ilyithenensis TaxID=2484901 RepID=A0A4R9LQS9_9LEPT|nr:hypothetical protein [Leptospira ilyithenensis]TGN11871.1 hypothetical protein EHS11_05005 [Leptospira ilyithenensis]